MDCRTKLSRHFLFGNQRKEAKQKGQNFQIEVMYTRIIHFIKTLCCSKRSCYIYSQTIVFFASFTPFTRQTKPPKTYLFFLLPYESTLSRWFCSRIFFLSQPLRSSTIVNFLGPAFSFFFCLSSFKSNFVHFVRCVWGDVQAREYPKRNELRTSNIHPNRRWSRKKKAVYNRNYKMPNWTSRMKILRNFLLLWAKIILSDFLQIFWLGKGIHKHKAEVQK